MKRKRKIIFMPYNHQGNEYIDNFKYFLSDSFEVDYFSFSPLKTIKARYAILHWRENRFISSDGLLNYYGFMKEVFRVIFLRILKCKVIIVKHNAYPHNTPEKKVNQIEFLQNVYYRMANVVICHSPVYQKSLRLAYIPHPIYTRVVNSFEILSENYYLVFGRIVSYKKIENIIKNFPSDKVLIISGPCEDEKYLDFLKAEAGINIVFDIGFREQGELNFLIQNSVAVLFAADSGDMIVSGAVHLALCLGIKIYCIESDYLVWLNSNFPELNISILTSFSQLPSYIDDNPDPRSIIDNSSYLIAHGKDKFNEHFRKVISNGS